MLFSKERLERLLATFADQKILVVGDLMIDEFLWGKVSRISPEAPVPVVEVQRASYYPGGAANVVHNLSAFGLKPTVMGVIGQDAAGEQLLKLLKESGARIEGIFQNPSRPTTQKTRIVARQQQVVRVDRETKQILTAAEEKYLLDFLKKEMASHDAIIIEDYAKGVVTQNLADGIIAEARHQGKIVAIDPNPHNPLQWSGATVIKPNRSEAFLAANLPYQDSDAAILKAGEVLRQKWESRYLLITLGEEGMLLLEKNKPFYHTPTRAREVFDVSGAGDTVIAVFTLALAAGASGIEAAELANHAAGVVVGKLGTATLTLEELQQSFVQP